MHVFGCKESTRKTKKIRINFLREHEHEQTCSGEKRT